MELAKQLLIDTDMSAVEISEKCGYYDYAHFSKVFMKYACVSPAKYRKKKLSCLCFPNMKLFLTAVN